MKTYISIFKTLTSMSESLIVSEQLVTTKELFHKDYAGVNPISDEAQIPAVREQMSMITTGIAKKSFDVIRDNKAVINFVEYNYFGYSREVLLDMLMSIVLTKDIKDNVRNEYISKFSMIADELPYDLAKSLWFMLIIALKYESDELVAVIAYYFYINCSLSTVR